MSEPRRFGWLGVAIFFLAGCAATFIALRYWPLIGTPVSPVSQAVQQEQKTWRFQVDFKIPSAVVVNSPDKTPILSFNVERPKNEFSSYPVTIKNISGHNYAVTYKLFAYDAQNRRVDEASDEVTIEARETVLRQLDFSQPAWIVGRFASFQLVADIQH